MMLIILMSLGQETSSALQWNIFPTGVILKGILPKIFRIFHFSSKRNIPAYILGYSIGILGIISFYSMANVIVGYITESFSI